MKRDFKGIWIPANIWLSKDLSVMEKLFLVEIDSLDNKDGCFASNAYFSEFFDVSKGRCTQIIKSLEAKGYINIQHERKGKQIIKRVIKVVSKLTRVVSKLNDPLSKTKQGCLENDEGSNTLINNTFNNYSFVGLTKCISLVVNFDSFWNWYPKKQGKRDAMKAFATSKIDNLVIQQIFNNLHQRRLAGDFSDERIQYLPMPSTYLRGRRWDDDIKKRSTQNANKQSATERRSDYASNIYDYDKATNL